MLSLYDIADKICGLRICIENQRQTVEVLQEKIAAIELEVDVAVSFDPNLKNDAQRRVHRARALAEDKAWGLLQTELKTNQREIKSLEIELELQRHRFTVLKLAEQREIAEMQQSA